MARWLFVVALILSPSAFSTGCDWHSRVNKLSDSEFSHYYALKPFMDEDTQKAYLKLKTEDERNKYLKDKGLWQRFYKYPDNMRQAIVDGAVQVGWTKDMVLMSWGAPYDKRKLAGRPAPRSEMLVYKFEKHEDGTILVYVPNSKTEYKAIDRFTREVILDTSPSDPRDMVVAEITEEPGWGN